MRAFLLVVWFLVCFVLGVVSPSAVFSQSLQLQIQKDLRGLLPSEVTPPRLELGRQSVRLHPAVAPFYAGRYYSAAWVSDSGRVPQADVLLDALRGAADEGLCPEDYHVEQIQALLQLAAASPRYGVLYDSRWMARLDLLLTDAFLWYAADHLQGRAAFAELRQQGWRDSKVSVQSLLEQALRRNRLSDVLVELVPEEPGYRQLLTYLESYRQLSVRGGWPRVPDGAVLRPNERDPRVPLLKKRLQLTDAVEPFAEMSSQVMTADVVRALRRFQRRHGLSPDGVLGARTLAELNVPVTERIRQIEWNLERWRWLPKSTAKRYVQVNIADFSLQVIEGGLVVMSMPVIVGSEYRKTPVFSGEISYLEFSPYWYVPPTILRKDKLPLIRRNPQWLSKNHFEIVDWNDPKKIIDPARINWSKITAKNFPGALRQKPGPWNALGQVKFMFPNRLSIYLHDTSDRQLFHRRVRLLSSGCIRIERPLDLAQYLLEPQGVGCDEILAATERDSPRRISLARPVPIQILYRTAWVDGHGMIQFRKDFYLRDLDMDVALEEWRSAEERAKRDF